MMKDRLLRPSLVCIKKTTESEKKTRKIKKNIEKHAKNDEK